MSNSVATLQTKRALKQYGISCEYFSLVEAAVTRSRSGRRVY